MPVLDALKRRQNLTDTEESLAEYVLSHADEVADMSIAELSTVAHVSNAAVVRFCKKLGIDGYRAFRIELARDLERSRTNLLNVNPDQPFLEDANTKDIVSSIAALTKRAVDETYAALSMQEVRKAARLVRGARRVVLYGVGDSLISLIAFSNLLVKLDIICVNADQYNDGDIVGNFLSPRDVAIFVTYSGGLASNHARQIAAVRSHGCHTILITADETLSDRFAGTDCMLLLPHGESRKGRIATYYSQTCIRFVLNCIYGEIFAQGWKESEAARERIADADTWTDE